MIMEVPISQLSGYCGVLPVHQYWNVDLAKSPSGTSMSLGRPVSTSSGMVFSWLISVVRPWAVF